MKAVIGADAVIGNFTRTERELKDKLKLLIGESTKAVLSAAQNQAPVAEVNGGNLQDSITIVTHAEIPAQDVIVTAPYGAFVEFGTGRRGDGSEHSPLPDDYKHGPKPGMAAQPFLFPALEAERPEFERKVTELLKDR